MNKPLQKQYRGYVVRFGPAAPVTGRWTASRFGVFICAGTEDALKKMIDQRICDAQNSGPIGQPNLGL